VLEGVVGAQIAEQVIEAGPGAVLVKPRGVPHAFWNPRDQPARLLEIISPAGFRTTLHRPGGYPVRPRAPDTGQLAALGSRYGLEVDLASIPRLATAYGLTVALPERMQPTTTSNPVAAGDRQRSWHSPRHERRNAVHGGNA